MTPSPWTSAYVGLPYVLGQGECVHLAAAVWRERFGIEVEVTAAHGDLLKAHRLIQARLAGGEWARVVTPEEGDAVVMRKGLLTCHVGVWVEPGHVLHCTRAHGTVVTPAEDLPALGFEIVGCYQKVELRIAA